MTMRLSTATENGTSLVRAAMNSRVTRWATLAVVLTMVSVLIYFLEPMSQNPMAIVHAARSFMQSVPYPFFVFVGFIVIGSLAFIPINILLVAAALIFPGWKGFFCGLIGVLLTTLVEYAVGRNLVSSEFLEQKCGERFRAVKKRVTEHGLAAMTFLSLVPVAPHIVNNLVAGACRVKVMDLLLGTAIGVTPGLLVINIFGRSVRRFIAHPDWVTAGLAVGVLIAMIWLMRLLHNYMSRKRSEAHGLSSVH